MTPVSEDPAADASKRLQAGLQLVAKALASTSLDVLAEAISKDDTQVSRIRSGQLGATIADVVRLMNAAGLKIVPADRVCVARDKYEAMVTIASAAMSDAATVRRLTWEGDA
jgi:hypothetical protein